MKTLSIIVLSLLVTVSYAWASGGTRVEGMVSFFIAFGVLIVMNQFIPGLMLIGGMVKEIFSPTDQKVMAAGSK